MCLLNREKNYGGTAICFKSNQVDLYLHVGMIDTVSYIDYLGFFPTKDMQTPSHPRLSFDPVFMDDALCAETNEKSIFRFLFLELLWQFIENWGDDVKKIT